MNEAACRHVSNIDGVQLVDSRLLQRRQRRIRCQSVVDGRLKGRAQILRRAVEQGVEPVDVPKILATAASAAPSLARLIEGLLKRLG